MLSQQISATLRSFIAIVAVLMCTGNSQAVTLDFEAFSEGQIITSADLPAGVTLTVENGRAAHPDAAVIFDSACGDGCTGNDGDLQTPGRGAGNDTAQNHVLIIGEDIADDNGDGLVDDPDDELNGGTITFTFDPAQKLTSVRVIDIDTTEPGSFLQVTTVSGGSQTFPFAQLGDNSAETIDIPLAQAITEARFVFDGTAAIDDLVCETACGDGMLDPGEECDPPASKGGASNCSDGCTITGPFCENGVVDPQEECDPPASKGGAPNCNDDCLFAKCGDGSVEASEQCDPPASQGGAANCNDDCSTEICGDGDVGAGETCDPPHSKGGAADCNDECQRVPLDCGNGTVDPPLEECDPPASEGGDPNCTDECKNAVCGNGVLEPSEGCDPPASQDGNPGCNDDCIPSECGDGDVQAGEECDPPASQSGLDNCRDDCTYSTCGNDELEPGEECDPPESENGEPGCSDTCKFQVCGNGELESGEECDPPASAGGMDSCTDECLFEDSCGDGVVDPGEECDPPDGGVTCTAQCKFPPGRCGNGVIDEGEECDPPDGGATCTAQCKYPPGPCGNGIINEGETCDPPTTPDRCPDPLDNEDLEDYENEVDDTFVPAPPACLPNCQLAVCGNGIVEEGETCDPPNLQTNGEDCHNGDDDDDDGFIDCEDLDSCPKRGDPDFDLPWCGFECCLRLSCKDILGDPATIKFGKNGDPDKFQIHGRTRVSHRSYDAAEATFGIRLTNAGGLIYEAFLSPGDLKPRRGSSRKRHLFKDSEAARGGGTRAGLAKVTTRERVIRGQEFVTFKIRAYGDFSAATEPRMTTQIFGVQGNAVLTADWKRKNWGWALRLRDF